MVNYVINDLIRDDNGSNDFYNKFQELDERLSNENTTEMMPLRANEFFRKAYMTGKKMGDNLRGQLLMWSLVKYGDQDARDILAKNVNLVEKIKIPDIPSEEAYKDFYYSLLDKRKAIGYTEYQKYDDDLLNSIVKKSFAQKLDALKDESFKTFSFDRESGRVSFDIPVNVSEAMKLFLKQGGIGTNHVFESQNPRKTNLVMEESIHNNSLLIRGQGMLALSLDLEKSKLTKSINDKQASASDEQVFNQVYKELQDNINAILDFITKAPFNLSAKEKSQPIEFRNYNPGFQKQSMSKESSQDFHVADKFSPFGIKLAA